jgi:hypothetical protein
MAGKERLVDGHVLERDSPLIIKLQNPIDQQKRISMREELEETLQRLRVLLGQRQALYFKIVDRPLGFSSGGSSEAAAGPNLPPSRSASSPSEPGLTFIAS